MENCKSMIVLSAAMTLDGKIGQRNNKVVLSSKSDKIRVHKLRSKFDAILVGNNTVEQDDPLLTVRHAKGKNPIRIILDSHGTIKNTSKIIKTAKNIPTIIVISQLVSKRNFSRLKNLPLDVIVCGKNQVDVRKLVPILCKKGIKKILVEGGGTLNLSFLKNNLINEIIVTIAPFVLGSENSVNLFEGILKPTKNLSSFKLKKVQKNTNEIVLNYKF
ncbi:MAG: 2,5-diamino-6-(ribosylamino)-4(3H)-pyrimidinone 5'-phosphate reductase [Candidatus Nitrosopelagicus sp.]|nr:2,5-diamino-6-(ribosylamino)-4(3H)-pyrimidinone 5'-phosphate reductase [Candidatus Nitrosopelagicus sp.]